MARRRPRSGTARYIADLRRAIEADPPSDLRVAWLTGPPGFPRRGRATGLANAALDLAWMHVLVPLVALARRARLVHGTFNWIPARCPCPTSVTIQDLAWERMPESFDPAFARFASRFTRLAARRARVVVVPSRATADDLVALYGMDPARARVVPLGVAQPQVEAATREPFILAVGANEPRKRMVELAEAHRRYADRVEHPYDLVIVGDPGPMEGALRAVPGDRRLAGSVSDAELADLYRRASLMVYPSALEGFGLPILEAMSHGCPVLCARNSSLPEVGGDAALYLERTDPASFAERLAEVLSDPEALRHRGERSREHAAAFTLARTARETLDALRQAL